MAYLGNDLQVAFPVYRNIDDISGSFNSSTTSFPLRVSGVAPVPAPLYSQQCLISVGGVVQRPDDSGSEGFRLSGGNIIFASAPTTGADFFGVILAGADYINAGGNFPSGTAAVPSITFNDDLDTGIYNSGINQVSITTGGSERLRIDSAGQIESVSLGTAAAPAFSFTTDPNTGIYSPGADQVAISTGGSGRLFVDASGNVKVGSTDNSNAGSQYITVGAPGSAIGGLQLWSTTTGQSYVQFGDGTASADQYRGYMAYLHADDALTFGTASSERLRITSAGLVGIGTSSPGRNLHVAGSSATALIESTGSTNADLLIGDGGVRYYGIRGVAGGGSLQIRNDTANTTLATFTSTGLVGIGTTTPQHLLDCTSIGRFTGNTNSAASGAGIEIGYDSGNTTGFIQSYNRGSSTYLSTAVDGSDVRLKTSSTERARIDSSGRLLVGTSSARSNFFNSTETADFQVESTNGLASIIRNTNATGGPGLILGKTRSTSVGGTTIVQSGDLIGAVSFQGSDGSEFVAAASVEAYVDGTPGANDMPGRLVFSTTADGASSPTERYRITQDGRHIYSNTGYLYADTDNAAQLGGPSNRFTAVYAVNGSIQTSDRREKAHIEASALGSDFIRSLRPVSYKWIEGGKRDTGKRDEDNNYIYESVPGQRTHWGFIAQEVKQAVDAAGVDFGGWVLTDKNDPDSQQALRYDQFIAPLTKALQEALAEIDVLKAKVAALESA